MPKYRYILGGHNDEEGLPSPKEYGSRAEADKAMREEMANYDGGSVWSRIEVDENDDGVWVKA